MSSVPHELRELLAEIVAEDVKLRPAGSRLVGLCPFHPDRRPSFVVFPQTLRFRCFGCGACGDVVDYLERARGLRFSEAVAYLRRQAGLPERPRSRRYRR